MSKRVIYSAFNDERLLIVDCLEKKHNWNPVFIYAAEQLRKWAEEYYPESIFQEEMAIRRSHFDFTKIGSPVPIDAKIIHALSKYELSCLNLVEDVTGWNFSFYERRRYYYDLLKYWNTVIHHLKPDLYLNLSVPHTVADYTLYLLCKHYYSIPTVFFSPLPLFEDGSYAVLTSLEDRSTTFKGIYNSRQNINLEPKVKKHLDRLRSNDRKAPTYIRNTYEMMKKYERFQYLDFIKYIVLIFLGRAFKSSNTAFKRNRKPFDSPKSKMNRFQYFWFKENLRRKNKKLGKIYNSFCKDPDMEKKYIYFAVSYQPEATTCPNAGVYEDVFLALDILSASIPDDWTIYFKEHPGTFSGFMRGSLRRDRHFYKKVASYHNVKIIPAETDTFELIDHSMAVATPTGTVGWEAAVGGKPVMFFGNAWYQGCRSLFRINTYQDCIDAIDKIRNGYVPDQKDLERYISALQKVSVKGAVHRGFTNSIKNHPDIKFEMERTAEVFYETYERHYGEGDAGLMRSDNLLKGDLCNEMKGRE